VKFKLFTVHLWGQNYNAFSGTHWIAGWVGTLASLDMALKNNLLFPSLSLLGIKPQLSSPWPTHYTNWAIQVYWEDSKQIQTKVCKWRNSYYAHFHETLCTLTSRPCGNMQPLVWISFNFFYFFLSGLLLVVCLFPVSDIWRDAVSKYWTFVPIIWIRLVQSSCTSQDTGAVGCRKLLCLKTYSDWAS
jgi:hypothetical protein